MVNVWYVACVKKQEKKEKVLQTIAVLVVSGNLREKTNKRVLLSFYKGTFRKKKSRKVVKTNGKKREMDYSGLGGRVGGGRLFCASWQKHFCKNTKTATIQQQGRQCRHHRIEEQNDIGPNWRNLEKGRLDHGGVA
jgi:hypothetical protein